MVSSLEGDVRAALSSLGLDYRLNEDGLTANERVTDHGIRIQIATGPSSRFWYVENFPDLPEHHTAVLLERIHNRVRWGVIFAALEEGQPSVMCAPDYAGRGTFRKFIDAYARARTAR